MLGENDRTSTRSTTAGLSLKQATKTDGLFGHENHFVVGASFDSSVTFASAKARKLGARSVVKNSTSSAVAEYFLDKSGDPVSIGPVALRTTNQYSGLYALDTFDVSSQMPFSSYYRGLLV